MKKNCVVYFSHDKQNYVSGTIQNLKIGNTKVVALKIHELLNCDIFEIQPLQDYPSDYHECTEIAKKELHNHERVEILNSVSHIEDYQNIHIGYPNWWGTMPMCMWTFLESYDLNGKHIYPFCTHEGSGLGSSVQDIKRLCPKSFVHEGLDIYGSQVNQLDTKIKEWLKENV